MLRRLLAILVALLLLGGAAAVVVLVAKGHKSKPPQPGIFYRIPATLPHGAPGTIVRSQPLTGLDKTMLGWRVMYITHGYDNHRTVVTGMILVPAHLGRDRDIVVFAHPTVGVAQRCGPSVYGADYAQYIDGLERFIRAGDAVVVPDMQGLGTAGPHPYLIPKAEARTMIDGARAAHKFAQAAAGTQYAVVGSSQGGQAAIATAELQAKSAYGKGMTLLGVAAGAPPIRLTDLFARVTGTPVGDLLSVLTLSSWASVYGKPSLTNVLTPAAQQTIATIDAACVQNPAKLSKAVPESVLGRVRFVRKHPSKTHTWAVLLHENTMHPFTTQIPLVVVQGEDDTLVPANGTTAYVRDLCDRRDTVAYRTYPGVNHGSIGAQSALYVTGWIAGRFADRTAPDSCPH